MPKDAIVNFKSQGAEKVVKDTQKVASAQEQLNKELEENRDAVALADRFTGGYAGKLVNLRTELKQGSKFVKTMTTAVKGLRTAIIATGIGALVVAVAALIAYWDEIRDFVKGTTKTLKDQETQLQNIGEELETNKGILEKQKELAELQGKPTKEITKELRKQIILQQENNRKLLENLEIQLQRKKEQEEEVTWWEFVKAKAAGLVSSERELQMLQNARTADSEEYLELVDKVNQAKQNEVDFEVQLARLDKEERDAEQEKKDQADKDKADEQAKIDADNAEKLQKLQDYLKQVEQLETAYFDSKLSKQQQEENAVADKYFALIEQAEQYGYDTTVLEEARQAQLKEIRDRYNKEEKDANDKKAKEDKDMAFAVNMAKLDAAKQGFDILGNLAKKGSKVQKKAAVMSARISAIAGTVNAFKTASDNPITTFFPPYPFIQAAAAAAAGFKNVKAIKASQFESEDTTEVKAEGGRGAAPTAVSQAPAFNIVGSTGTNQIASALGESAKQPSRAYVVSSDVTTAQELERKTVQGASIG